MKIACLDCIYDASPYNYDPFHITLCTIPRPDHSAATESQSFVPRPRRCSHFHAPLCILCIEPLRNYTQWCMNDSTAGGYIVPLPSFRASSMLVMPRRWAVGSNIIWCTRRKTAAWPRAATSFPCGPPLRSHSGRGP
jgi:hypothetical protein